VANPRDLGIDLADPGLEAAIGRGLDDAEEQLHASVKSDYPFVTETSRHLVEAGGKRLRPLLVLLASYFGNPRAPGVLPAAVAVELTHLATLYHDDVMDEAPLRRGASSANLRWGNTVAILTGDFLFARASDILADLGPVAVRIQARTFERLVAGQIRESVGPEPGVDPVQHYLRVVADKTGSLIGACARYGSLLSGADEPTVERLTRFGERIGVAFQLSDDVLDLAADAGESGKEPGTDLREGIRTLPVLLALRTLGPTARLRELLAGDLTGDDRRAEALAGLRAHPALAEARRITAGWAGEAAAALEPLPDVPAKAALQSVCRAIVDRNR
jgi:heptaprenyl diphosphate synthase